ncbi:MAG: hypothetical protein ACKVON_13175 [Beijerinckiaceae bacterium]
MPAYNDPNWFFTDEPTVMWGRQLTYLERKPGEEYVVTPDNRRFTSLRRAFALYRVGTGERGPGDEQLEIMRRTMAWIHCGKYEQPIVDESAKCPVVPRGARLNELRIICDVFGGSRPLFEHHLLHLEMLRFITMADPGAYVLTREGQAALIMLEVTRKGSGISTGIGMLEWIHRQGRWLTVDSNRWATGLIVAGESEMHEARV